MNNLFIREQKYIRTLIKEEDDLDWSLEKPGSLRYVSISVRWLFCLIISQQIGGVDISFSPDDEELAVSYLVVLTYPGLKVIDFSM